MSRTTYGTEADTNELLQASKQPAALRLADLLEKTSAIPLHGKAADELRRLYAERNELLDALRAARLHIDGEALPTKAGALEIIDAAITQATGVTS